VVLDRQATALVLGGGGARGAYQAGVVRAIAQHYPGLELPLLTGISAGAINAAFLGAHSGSFATAADELAKIWLSLTPETVYRVDAGTLGRNVIRWGWRLVSGGVGIAKEPTRGFVDTSPLFQYLAQLFAAHGQAPISGIKRTPIEEKKAKAPAPAPATEAEVQEAAAPEAVPAEEIEN